MFVGRHADSPFKVEGVFIFIWHLHRVECERIGLLGVGIVSLWFQQPSAEEYIQIENHLLELGGWCNGTSRGQNIP